MNVSETNSSTQQNNTKSNSVTVDTQANSTLQQAAQAFLRMDRVICLYLAEACRKFDHEDFKLQSLAQFHGFPTVSEWAEFIESRVMTINSACTHKHESPETYLKSTPNAICWAEAEIVFDQSMDRTRYDPNSGPVTTGQQLIYYLSAHSSRSSALIADLLPELFELKLFDLQMQAVLRGKWIILDSIMDSWHRQERIDHCDVPRWLVKPIPMAFCNRN